MPRKVIDSPKTSLWAEARRKKYRDLYDDWVAALAECPERPRDPLMAALMEKYGLFSRNAIYRIIKREKERRMAEGQTFNGHHWIPDGYAAD